MEKSIALEQDSNLDDSDDTDNKTDCCNDNALLKRSRNYQLK